MWSMSFTVHPLRFLTLLLRMEAGLPEFERPAVTHSTVEHNAEAAQGKVLEGPGSLVHPDISLALFSSALCLAIQLCPALCSPVDCSPPGSSVCGILQRRILGWVAYPFSRGTF